MLSGRKDSDLVPYHLGHFFIALNISSFIDLDKFKKTAGEILRTLRNSKKMPGENRIYTAGEKEHISWISRKDKGVPVNKRLQEEMIAMRDELCLTNCDFPF